LKTRLVGRTAKLVAVVAGRHDVLGALPLANEARPGDRLLTGTDAEQHRIVAIDLATRRFEALDRLWLQSVVGQFLDAVAETTFEEAPIVGRAC
jgi:hypothetical protein